MITIYDWFGYELPIKKRYQLIKEAGFDGVLLWWSNGFGRDSLNQNDYRNGPKIVRDAGLFIENIHTPVQNQNHLWLDNLAGDTLTNCYLKCVADCAEFEIPTMVVHLPDDNYPCNVLGLSRINKIVERAETYDINVALENVRNLSNVEYVLEHVKSPRLGFCYDSCHHHNYNLDIDLLAEYGSKMMAIHLHDNGGSRVQHTLPFDGSIDWTTTMKKIANTGYIGPTALEAMNWEYQHLSPEEFLQQAFVRAKRLESLRS